MHRAFVTTRGLRHVALRVRDVRATKVFHRDNNTVVQILHAPRLGEPSAP